MDFDLEERIARSTPYAELRRRAESYQHGSAADRARLEGLDAARHAWAGEAVRSAGLDLDAFAARAWQPVEVPPWRWQDPWARAPRLAAALEAMGVLPEAEVKWSGDRSGPEVPCAAVRGEWEQAGLRLKASLGYTAHAPRCVTEWLTLRVWAPERLGGGWVTVQTWKR